MNISLRAPKSPGHVKNFKNKTIAPNGASSELDAASDAINSITITGQGQYLRKKFIEAGDLASAARAMGKSSVATLRNCKQILGQTPGRLIRESRLVDAARSLVLGQQRILNVALDHGYNSQAAFSRAFSRYFGSTPADLKRRYVTLQAEQKNDALPSFRKMKMPEIRGLGCEYNGSYSDLEPAIAVLFKWALGRGLLKGGNISPSVIYQEHSWVFKNKMKAWIVLPIEGPGDSAKGIVPVIIPGGSVYECIHKGPYQDVVNTFNLLLKAISQRHTPCFDHEAAIVTFGTRTTNTITNMMVSSEFESIVRIRAYDI